MASLEALKLGEDKHIVYVKSVVGEKEVAPCSPGAEVTIYFGFIDRIQAASISGIPHVDSVKGLYTVIEIAGANIDQKKVFICPSVYSKGFLRVKPEPTDDEIYKCSGDEKLEQQLEAVGFGTRFRYVGRKLEFLPTE